MLEVIVHRDHDRVARGADPGQERVVLAVVPHEIDAADPAVLPGRLADPVPGFVPAAVVDQDDLEAVGDGGQHGGEALDQAGQARLAVVDGDHDPTLALPAAPGCHGQPWPRTLARPHGSTYSSAGAGAGSGPPCGAGTASEARHATSSDAASARSGASRSARSDSLR